MWSRKVRASTTARSVVSLLTLGIKRRRISKKNGLLWQKVRSINETSISVRHEDDADDEPTPHDITRGLVASS